MKQIKLTNEHRALAQALLDTFRPRMDMYAERFDDDEHVARVNAWMKERGNDRGFRVGDWKPAGPKSSPKPLTLHIVAEHVAGRKTIGFYPLHDDNSTNTVSVDFDNHRGSVMVERDPREDLDAVINVCLRRGVRFLANHSRGGAGYWLHLLPPPGIQAREARAVLTALLKEAEVRHISDGGTIDALFPKQDALFSRGENTRVSPGNLYCVPCNGRWMRAETPGTHFLHTPAGDLAAQLKHLLEY